MNNQTHPIHLTDDILSEVEYRLSRVDDQDTLHTAQQLIDAIRALRDRARAVVDDSSEGWGDDKGDSFVRNEVLDALRDVLP